MPDLKVLTTEITLTTANTVGNGSLIRVVNLDSTNTVLITLKESSTTIGTFTLGTKDSSYGVEYVIKEPTQTLEVTGTAVIKATSVGYY